MWWSGTQLFICIVVMYGGEVRTEEQDVIPIGGIFQESSELYTAFQFAVKMANLDKVIQYKIDDEVDLIEASNSYHLAEFMCTHLARGVFALFGVSNSSSSHVQQSLSQRLHMPYITPHIIRSHTQPGRVDQYTVSMSPHILEPIMDVIHAYRWNAIYYIYDTDDGLFRLQNIYESFSGHDTRLQVLPWRISNIFSCHETLRHLDRSSDGDKYMIVDLSSTAAYQALLVQIVQVGMHRDHYHYVLGTLAIKELDLTPLLYGGVNITGFSLPPMGKKREEKFMAKWNVYTKNWPGGRANQISTESLLMIDGVQAFVNGMSKLKTDDFKEVFRRGQLYNNGTVGIRCNDSPPRPWVLGERIIRNIRQGMFTGWTGNVSFGGRGSRNMYTLDLLELNLRTPLRKIGDWNDMRGLRSNYTYVERNYTAFEFPNNHTYIITTIATPPYTMLKTASEDGKVLVGNERFEGYCVELAEELAKKLGFVGKYRIKLVDDGEYGSVKSDGHWTGMIGELDRHEADMAIAPLSITHKRQRSVDFTKPFMTTGISIMIKKPEPQKAGVFSFMDPLDTYVWLCIVIGFLAVSLVLYFVGRFSPYEWPVEPKAAPEEDKRPTRSAMVNQFSLFNTLWFSLGAIMQQGSDISPRSLSGRIVGSGWWFFTLFIISSYTANLAAFLTIEKILTPIKDVADLARQSKIKYGIVNSGSSKEFFTTTKISIYSDMGTLMKQWGDEVYVSKIQEGVEKVRRSKGKYAFLLESTMNEYHNQRMPCNTIKVGPNLDSKGYGVGTPKNSPLRERLNVAVLELGEKGELTKLETKWWLDKGQCGHEGSKDAKQGALTLSNVSGIFHILIGGLGLSMLTALVEYIYKSTISRKYKQMKGTIDDIDRITGERLVYYDPPPYSRQSNMYESHLPGNCGPRFRGGASGFTPHNHENPDG